MRPQELDASVRTCWSPPAALILLGFGGVGRVSRVGCGLFPASEESHCRGGGGGEPEGSGERERDETTEIGRLKVDDTAAAETDRLTNGRPIANIWGIILFDSRSR